MRLRLLAAAVAASLAALVVPAEALVQKLHWSALAGTGDDVGARAGGLLLANETHVAVHGGWGPSDRNGNQNNEYVISLSSGEWTRVRVTSDSFASISKDATHMMVENEAFIYGGYSSSFNENSLTSTVWRAILQDDNTVAYQTLAQTNTESRGTARRMAAGVVLPNCNGNANSWCIVVHGGTSLDGSSAYTDTRTLTGIRSTAPRWDRFSATLDNAPGASIESSLDVDYTGTGAVLFGGRTGSAASTATSNVYLFTSAGFPDRPETHGNIGTAANGKTATQSSTWGGNVASRSLDGDYGNYRMDSGKCSHTNPSTDPWWQVDLKRVYSLSRVRIHNRRDNDPEGRIRGFQVWVSNKPDIADVLAEGFLCPNPFDTISSNFADIPCVTAGRYVTIRIPGENKMIQICEVETFAGRYWTWAQLGGTEEVAQGRPTQQSSFSQTNFDNSVRAVDGNTATLFDSGSCTHTRWEGQPWWYVDILRSREIESVRIWERTESCCAGRLSNFEIRVGFGSRWQDAEICATVSDITTSGTYTCEKPIVGRSVFVVMRGTGILSLCEVKVFARKLRNLPSPRFGHAHTSSRGMVYYFGGVGDDGKVLNDLHVFDTYANEFRTPGSLVGVDVNSGFVPPSPRTHAMMITSADRDGSTLFVMGGRDAATGGTILVDAHKVAFRTCPSMTETDAGVDTPTCNRGSCYYTCKAGFTDANQVVAEYGTQRPAVCVPDGFFMGANKVPFCKGETPPKPSRPTATVAGQEEAAQVSWTAVADTSSMHVDAYRVRAEPMSYVDHFSAMGSLGPGWTFEAGGVQGNRFELLGDGQLGLLGQAGTNCWEWWNVRCARILRKPPAAIGASYAIETRVTMDNAYFNDNTFGGLVLWNDNGANGGIGHQAIYWGIRRVSGGFQLNAEASSWGFAFLDVPSSSASLRVTYNAAENTWSFLYRLDDYDTLGNENPWLTFYDRLSGTSIGGGAPAANRWRVGPMVKTWGGNAKFWWDYIKISARECNLPGAERVVSNASTSAVVPGLTPSVDYSFTVQARSKEGGWGVASDASTSVVPTYKAADNLVNVAFRKPTRQISTYDNRLASWRAVNDDAIRVNPAWDTCTHTWWHNVVWWTVDLEAEEDIKEIYISGRADCCQERIWGLQIWVGNNRNAFDGAGNQRCAADAVPYSWSRAEDGRIPIRCGLKGQHVWVVSFNNFQTLCGVRVMAASRCPADRESGGAAARSGSCSGATSGASCGVRCPIGTVATAGTESSTCTMGEWSGSPLRCEKVCDALAAPAGSARCEHSIFQEDFDTPATALRRFLPADPVSRPLDESFHAQDGALVVSGEEVCQPDTVILAQDEGVRGAQGETRTRVRVHSTGQAGVVFRALNRDNMYAALLDFDSWEHVVLVVQDGVTTELDRRRVAIRSDEWHSITAEAVDKQVVVTLDDTVQLFNVTSVRLANGASGMWAAGGARFDDFSVSVPCLPGSGGSSVGACTSAAEHDTCAFACRSGFEPSGSSARTCAITDAVTDLHEWTGSAFSCRIQPPIVRDANRSVAENSPRGTAVGAAIPAQLEAEGEQMQFRIVAGDVGGAFRIDLCSGLITVFEPALLDFETSPVFVLTVNVSVADFPDSDASATVWVRLVDVDEPPIVTDSRFNVSEAAVQGTYVGRVTARDQEGDVLAYMPSFDQSEGMLRVDPSTGTITLDRAAVDAVTGASILDFERSSVSGPQLLMIIDVYQVNDTSKRSSAFITVDVLDANDAPGVTVPQFLMVDETIAQVPPAVVPSPLVAFDQDSGVFASSLSFELVRDGATGRLVGNTTTERGPSRNAFLTTTGLSSGTDLFSMAPASGLVTLMARPSSVALWSAMTPYLNQQGILVRAEYQLRARVTDNATDASGRSVALSTEASFWVVVDANITSQPILDGAVLATRRSEDLGTAGQQGSSATHMSTAGGELVNITGRFLTGSAVTAAWVSAQRSDLPGRPSRGFNMSSCAFVSNELIQCRSSPGWGSALDLHLEIDGLRALKATVLQLTYASPVVSSITGGSAMPTRGGGTVTLTGRHLGPVGAPVRFEFVRQEDLAAALSGTVAWRACAGAAVTVSSVQVRCSNPVGAGRGLAWRYVVDSNVATGSASYGNSASGEAYQTLLAYAPPVLTSVAASPAGPGAALTSLDTMGGQLLRVTGDNFGPPTASLRAFLSFSADSPVRRGATGSGLSGALLDLTECSRPVAGSEHSVMDCRSPAGVGVSLVLGLEVEGQGLFGNTDSTAGNSTNGTVVDPRQRLSYTGPGLVSVTGPGAQSASTRGGERVVVRGRHLGPVQLSALGSIGSVMYGPGRVGRFMAADCRVTQSIATGSAGGEQVMECLTAEGVGAGHSWMAAVATQSSPWLDAMTSYGAPIVAAFAGQGASVADTRGGQVISIQGSNFGPASLVNALQGLSALRVEYSVLITDITSSAVLAAAASRALPSGSDAAEEGLRVNFTAEGCSVVEDHSLVTCNTAPGAGSALSWKVTIDTLVSQNPVTSYAPPVITGIRLFADMQRTIPVAQANPNGGTWAMLGGNYFGPPNATIPGGAGPSSLVQWVGVGPSGREYTPSTWTHRSHAEILFPVPPGFGENLVAQVSVADQVSLVSTSSFSYARPVIVSMTPSVAETAGPAMAVASPRYVTIVARNLPLRDPTSTVVVLFGRRGLGQVVIVPTAFENEADASEAGTGNPRLRFALPRHGAGVELPVRVGVVSAGLAAAAVANGSSISPGAVAFASVCDTTVDGGAGAPTCLFTYSAPAVDSVSLARPSWARPSGSNDTTFEDAIEACPFGMPAAVSCSGGNSAFRPENCENTKIRRLVLYGRSFGSAAADAAFGTSRCLEYNWFSSPALGDLYDPSLVFVSQWDDHRIVAYLMEGSGKVRVDVTTPRDNSGARRVQTAFRSFQLESPQVSGREGDFTGMSTEGGRVLKLLAPQLDSFTTVEVMVAGRAVGLRRSGAAGFPTTPAATSALAKVGDPVDPLFELEFEVPVGHGASVPVFIRADGGLPSEVVSEAVANLAYAAPTVSSVDVGTVDPDTGVFQWTPVSEDVGRFTVRARTEGTFLRVRGSNLGPCPVASVALGATFGTYPAAGVAAGFCDATPSVGAAGRNDSSAATLLPRRTADGGMAALPVDRISDCDRAGDRPTGGAQADLSIQRCAIVPVHPGQGSGVRAGSAAGFQVQLTAAGQSHSDAAAVGSANARQVLLRYALPMVRSVAPSASAGLGAGIPTRGGVPIVISGHNFGELPPLGDPASTALAVRVGRLDRSVGAPEGAWSWFLPCESPRRMGHRAIECTLPEGAGESLDVQVTVASQSSAATDSGRLSYSPPYAAAVLVRHNASHEACVMTAAASALAVAPGGAAWPASCTAPGRVSSASHPGAMQAGNVPAAGGVNVTILGENFARRGLRVPLCVFATWEGASLTPVCEDDGTELVETFLGEGQVPPSRVLVHDHNRIVISLPPGVGARRLDVSVGGARLARSGSAARLLSASAVGGRSLATESRPRLVAARPMVGGLSPARGSTRGGTTVTLMGSHFGANTAAFNVSAAGAVLIGGRFMDASDPSRPRPIPAWMAAMAPTYHTVVHFAKRCVSDSAAVVGEFGCDVGGVESQEDRAIVFRTPAGVGVDKLVEVEIVDSRGRAFGSFRASGASPVFSYNPPRILTASPRTVMMRGDASNKRVEVLGTDFGGVPPDPCTEQTCWSAEERELSLSVGAVPCVDSQGNPSATRKVSGGETTVLCDLRPQVVGRKNVTLRIAGQGDFVETVDVVRAINMVCGVGAYGRPGETCIECPVGAECDGYVPELEPLNETKAAEDLGLAPGADVPTPHTYPRPLTGFFNLNSSDGFTSGMLAECPFSSRVTGRDVCIVRCDPPWACEGDNFCGEGYASTPRYKFRCNDCDQGYYRRTNGNCEKCPDDPALLIVVFVLVVIAASVVAYYLASKNIALMQPFVLVDYFQVLAIFSSSRVPLPKIVSDILSFFSAFALDLNITAPECLVPNLGFLFRYGVTMALPIAAMALFSLLFVFNYAWARIIKRQTRAKGCEAADTLVAMGLTGGYVLYVQLCRTMFSSLACAPNNPPEFDESGNLIQYLQVVPESCAEPGGVYQTLLPFTVIGIIVYLIGYPVLVGWVLLRNRQLVVEDQLLRCKGVGDSESTNPNALHMRKRFGRIYYAFAPQFAPFWLQVLLARKLFLTATALVFVRTPSWQLTLSLLVLFVAYALQVRYRPWLVTTEREKHLSSHRVRALQPGSIDNRIAATVATAESRMRKRATFGSLDASSARARAMQVGTVIYGSVLNNTNTLDAVLLTCSILISICGLLFESDRFASELPFYESQRDTLAILVGIVIIFGVVYGTSVVVIEFAALIRNSSMTAKERARDASKKAKKASKDGDSEPSSAAVGVIKTPGTAETGSVDLMHNPMMMSSADAVDGRGMVLQSDAAADAIASVHGKPDEQTWVVFKDAFLKLRGQVGEMARNNAELERRLEQVSGRGSRAGSSAGLVAAAAGRARKASFGQVRARGAESPGDTPVKASPGGGAEGKTMLSLARAANGRSLRGSRKRSLLAAAGKQKTEVGSLNPMQLSSGKSDDPKA